MSDECKGCKERKRCQETICFKEQIEQAKAEERERFTKQLAILCSYLHYSHSENEKTATESKGYPREICKGRMFEDCMILDALEELRVTGNIKIQSTPTATEANQK